MTIEKKLVLCALLNGRTTGACDGTRNHMEVVFRSDSEEFTLATGAVECFKAKTLDELCDGYIAQARGKLQELQAKDQADWQRRQASIQALL